MCKNKWHEMHYSEFVSVVHKTRSIILNICFQFFYLKKKLGSYLAFPYLAGPPRTSLEVMNENYGLPKIRQTQLH